MTVHQLRAGRIHVGDWREADLSPGYTLAIVDGPYAMGMAAWDRMKLDDLAEWYRPHLARVSELCAASASVYLWNTAAGWARLDPVMRAMGWSFRALITWDKGNPPSLVGWRTVKTWIDSTETCGFYQRGAPPFTMASCQTNVWTFNVSLLARERLENDTAIARDAGTLPGRISSERMALHPCQKPLHFAERMIRASTRPGERILVPFGGTCREAVVCEWLARAEPEEAREYDACELNADGVDYIGPVLAQIRGESSRPVAEGQTRLFG